MENGQSSDRELARLVEAARRSARSHESGLIVPVPPPSDVRQVSRTGSGLAKHAARYLISDEYAPRWVESRDAVYTPDAWLSSLLRMCPREDLLGALTAATRVAFAGGELLQEWTDHVLNSVEIGLGNHLRAALQLRDGGPPRVFLARQPLLLALKLILATPPPEQPGTADPSVVVTLLSHHAAREPVTSKRPNAGGQLIGGMSEPLAMEVVRNTLFNTGNDFGDMLGRTRLLWTICEARLDRYTPRMPLHDLLVEATGMGLDDILTMAFAAYSQALDAHVNQPRALDFSTLGLPQRTVETFLDRFSATDAELAKLLARQQGEWAFLPLEDTPLRRLGPSTAAVIDIELLQRRFTSALYWLVHDHERDAFGQQGRVAWTQVYSELVEVYAEDILRRLAPPLLDGASAFFSEEQLGKLSGKAADCGVDFGDVVLVADVVQHQMTVPTRMLGEVAAFEKDMRISVVKKAEQLDGTAEVLLRKYQNPSHPLRRRPSRILPMVVQGADFPANEVTIGYARQKAAELSLLAQPECDPLMIVTLAELEMAESIVCSGLASAGELFRAYSDTGAADSLRNWLVENSGGVGIPRPPTLQAALDEILDLFVTRFSLDSRP